MQVKITKLKEFISKEKSIKKTFLNKTEMSKKKLKIGWYAVIYRGSGYAIPNSISKLGRLLRR